MQSPIRKRGFYEATIAEWRAQGILRGLSEIETLLLAAQFAGLAVAAIDATPEEQKAHLDVAVRAMQTAYAGRMAVKQGIGRPKIVPREESAR